MIEIELKWALVLYSGVLGAIVLFIWVYTELTVRRPQRYFGQQFLWRCTFCGYTYLDESGQQYSTCPRCESIVAANDAHARVVPVQSEPAAEESGGPPGRNTSRRKRPHQRRRGPRRR